MKIERNPPPRGARSVAAGAYARAASAAPQPATADATATVMGIPEAEFTPRVREAIMTLMEEVETLRHELAGARDRLSQAEKEADQDQMLPVLGRRAFVRELSRHIAVNGRYQTPASLIYFDLNYLKRINDTLGHPAGDAMLRHFAETLNANVRGSDRVGRLGGDEFGVLLSHANHDQALRKADSLASVLRQSPMLWDDQEIPVSFAFGAFEIQPGDNADSAIARADEAMYVQKKSSRTAAE